MKRLLILQIKACLPLRHKAYRKDSQLNHKKSRKDKPGIRWAGKITDLSTEPNQHPEDCVLGGKLKQPSISLIPANITNKLYHLIRISSAPASVIPSLACQALMVKRRSSKRTERVSLLIPLLHDDAHINR
ncbi:hypothetical protein [Nitrosomonas communis]|uniref:hypothetical protein n=1 Tax=Nitrosomonas communis TaxID=44574 RepID=UPI0026F2A61E|nr:hypothetical protein [Nitrosomonas communis]MCO6427456.1 hypothetical protein [Nitrosomonas communis]